VKNGFAAHGVVSRRSVTPGSGRKAIPLTGVEESLWWYFVNRYFPANLRIRTKHTRMQYAIVMRGFKHYLGREPMLTDLDDDVVSAWMGQMLDDGLAPKTVNERAGWLKAFWSWLAKKRIVDQFPFVVRVKQPKRIPRAWRTEEFARLFLAAERKGGFWPALLSVLWDTAARIGEILALRWEWLEWETGVLSVPAEVRKCGERDMVYQLGADTLDRLRRLPRDSDLIFPFPRNRTLLYAEFKEILKDAGLPHDRNCFFHKIRRTVASYMQKAGYDACLMLKHSTPSVTIESYLDPAIVGTARPCDVLPRPGKDGAL
jgi:integrase